MLANSWNSRRYNYVCILGNALCVRYTGLGSLCGRMLIVEII